MSDDTTGDEANSNTTDVVTIYGDEWPANTLFVEDADNDVWAIAPEGEAPDHACPLTDGDVFGAYVNIDEWPSGLARRGYIFPVSHVNLVHHTEVTYTDFEALLEDVADSHHENQHAVTGSGSRIRGGADPLLVSAMCNDLLQTNQEITYQWYVAEPIPTVTLYKSTEIYEIPLYTNGHGQATFHSIDPECGNIEAVEPSDGFWRALDGLRGEGPPPADGCEWYEVEFLNELIAFANSVDNGDVPTEIEQLMSVAHERSQETSGDENTDAD